MIKIIVSAVEVKKLQIIENKYISHLLLLGAKGLLAGQKG